MFIPVSIALLALASGMFLLAKTNKEGLGLFFKSISIFIIAASFLVMGLTFVGGFTRMILQRAHANAWMNERGENRQQEFFHHKRHHKKRHHWRKDDDQRGEERWGSEENHMRDSNHMREHWREESHMGNSNMESHGMEYHSMPGNRMDDRIERSSDKFSEQLNLKPEQVKQLREILKTSMQKEAQIRSTTNGDREQFIKLSRENRQAKMDAIKKILTPEQLKLFNEKEQGRQAGQSQG